MKKKYDYEFYRERDAKTRYTAETVFGILNNYFTITSIVDIGGGVGTWAKTAEDMFQCKKSDVVLIEGDYIDKELLVLDEEQYISHNLEEKILLHRRFDVALTLEVAEHLSRERAKSFCEDLTQLSDIIIFSAAIPGQGGVGHINEQPLHYWVEYFEKYDYEAFDLVRPNIQNDMKIPYWYRQNILVYVNKKSQKYFNVKEKVKKLPPLEMVTYDEYMKKVKILNYFILYKGYVKLKRIFENLKRK